MTPHTARLPVLGLSLLTFVAAGCGPLSFPAVQRLPPQEQAQVEQMWANMLTPAGRLDRDLLLDTLISYQLHHLGIDRLSLHGEKDYAGGRVTMDIAFDRLRPNVDSFTVAVSDRCGRRVRLERYKGQEVLDHVHSLMYPPHSRQTDDNGQPVPEPPELAARRRDYEQRLERIEAATQPAR